MDGLIVEGTKSALPNPNLHLYEKLKEMGIPVVFFNSYYPALQGCVSVTMDDRQGGIDAVEYLVARGTGALGVSLKATTCRAWPGTRGIPGDCCATALRCRTNG